MNKNYFDRDYYERGIESGKSLYQNYRWMPEQTIPMAMTIIDYLDIKRGEKILDFGCAFGYLVKAFRLLYRDAWGFDISNYALSKIDSETTPFCSPTDVLSESFDYCIAKDVFEHMNESEIRSRLKKIKSKVLFAIIPLGESIKGYNAPSNNLDRSHIICENEFWWIDFFNSTGYWNVTDFRFRVDGIKDSYYEKFPNSHGFFVLKRC
jgi:hypothetical protein